LGLDAADILDGPGLSYYIVVRPRVADGSGLQQGPYKFGMSTSWSGACIGTAVRRGVVAGCHVVRQ